MQVCFEMNFKKRVERKLPPNLSRILFFNHTYFVFKVDSRRSYC